MRIDRAAFPWLLAELASWAREERIVKNAGFHERAIRELGPEHDFIQRVFSLWDVGCRGSLGFQDVVTGLDGCLFNDLMANVSWMFRSVCCSWAVLMLQRARRQLRRLSQQGRGPAAVRIAALHLPQRAWRHLCVC